MLNCLSQRYFAVVICKVSNVLRKRSGTLSGSIWYLAYSKTFSKYFANVLFRGKQIPTLEPDVILLLTIGDWNSWAPYYDLIDIKMCLQFQKYAFLCIYSCHPFFLLMSWRYTKSMNVRYLHTYYRYVLCCIYILTHNKPCYSIWVHGKI